MNRKLELKTINYAKELNGSFSLDYLVALNH